MRRAILLSAMLLLAMPAAAEEAGVCIENRTSHTMLFVAEARDGPRVTATLAAGETLCSGAGQGEGGVVSAFESAEHLEGCSRLVAEGRTEALLRYAEFDRCEWSSHHD